MSEQQPSLSEVEYSQRRRVPKREEFLNRMDAVVPWADWVALIEPHYFNKRRGRRPVGLETMLRMYLLQVWFHLSDEGVEDQINDSFAIPPAVRADGPTKTSFSPEGWSATFRPTLFRRVAVFFWR